MVLTVLIYRGKDSKKNTARMRAAGEGSTEPLLYFISKWIENTNESVLIRRIEKDLFDKSVNIVYSLKMYAYLPKHKRKYHS